MTGEGGGISLMFSFLAVVIAVVSVFSFFFGVVFFIYFEPYLNVDVTPIFLYRPKNVCNLEEQFMYPMTSMT